MHRSDILHNDLEEKCHHNETSFSRLMQKGLSVAHSVQYDVEGMIGRSIAYIHDVVEAHAMALK